MLPLSRFSCFAALLLAASGCGDVAASLAADKGAPAGPSLPPLANAGADREILRGFAAHLDATGSYHPQGNSFTLSWEQTSGPAVFLSSAAVPSPRFVAPLDECTLTFRLTVDDGAWVTTDDVTLRVRRSVAAVAPRVRAGADRFVDYAEPLSPLPSDLVQVAPVDAGSQWTPVIPTRSPRLPVGATPSFDATLFRLDGTMGGLSSAPDFLILYPFDETRRGEKAPVADVTAPLVVAPGELFQLDGRASSDPNGEALSFRWVQLRGDDLISPPATIPVLQLVAPARPQEILVRLFANDRSLESEPIDVTVVVDAMGAAAPLVSPPDSLRAHPGTEIWLDAQSALSARDTTGATFVWEQTAGTTVTLLGEGDGQHAHFTAPALVGSSASMDLAFAVYAKLGSVLGSPAVTRVTVVPLADNTPPAVSLCATKTAPLPGEEVSIRMALSEPESDKIASLEWASEPADAVVLAAGSAEGAVFLCGTQDALGLAFTNDYPTAFGAVHFVAPTAGTAVTLRATVCDELGACGHSEVVVTPAAD